MYGGYIESEVVFQNLRCWQVMLTSDIEDIWILKIQPGKIKSQTEIAGDIREIF